MDNEVFSNWMGDLYERFEAFGRIPINRLLMLGSHDSGTSRMSSLARTQALTIAEQLEVGIRYLDIRPRVSRSTYYVHHGESGPNGSADLGHYSAPLDPEAASNDTYIFKQIRDFLKRHPREILILKFQNYSGFGEHDYYDLVELVRSYLTFDEPDSKCSLVRCESGGGALIAKQTVESLLAAHQRVFVIFDTENVPTGPDAHRVWDWVFPFYPSLTQRDPFCLWDPYWHEQSSSLADDKSDADFARWWGWHDDNLKRWSDNPLSGFFALQSQMAQLPFADALGSAQRNNAKNLEHYLQRAAASAPLNVMTFDFVEQGDLSRRLVAYYERVLAG